MQNNERSFRELRAALERFRKNEIREMENSDMYYGDDISSGPAGFINWSAWAWGRAENENFSLTTDF